MKNFQEKFNPRIALFAYDFSHWKSENILKDCLINNIAVPIVFAAPKYDLISKKVCNYIPSEKLIDLCKNNNIKLVKCSHENHELIDRELRLENCNLGLIGGARKIKSEVINKFKYGIINYHPGTLPETVA